MLGEQNFVASLADLMALAISGFERRKAREEAENANHAKSYFLANMSHEIRTPMNSIVGFSELALNGEIPQKTRDYIKRILENSDWLLQIINDILDISKVESGKMELENVPFDLHKLFAACKTSIDPKAAEKRLDLYFYAEPSIGKKLLGDPTRLRQVLMNLLTNAVKFTNKGIVKLAASIIDGTSNKVTVRFEIKDSGIGMTPAQIKKIFEPFMQAESGTTRKYGGTGLGLPIAKSIIEMMGGKLMVESTAKVGSKFSFELTFNTIDLDDDSAGREILFTESEMPFFSGEVLLCEDNKMNREVMCEHLDRVGLKTVIAENGAEGLETVRGRMERGEKPFDLIFMDIYMPVMDGLEAAPLIAALNTGTPIVAMTANIMSHDLELYRHNSMVDCVGKPFRARELWSCLIKHITPVRMKNVSETGQKRDYEELQRRLRVYFVKSSKDIISEILSALDSNDITLAHRLAHTLKGNAGQLRKPELQKAAGDVESLLEDGINNLTLPYINTLEKELNAVIEEFARCAEDSRKQNKTHGSTLDADETRNVLTRLATLLDDGDTECLELIDTLRLIPGTEDLIHLIEDLDFESAAEALSEYVSRG